MIVQNRRNDESFAETTLNTRALQARDLRYIRNDSPGKLISSQIQWLIQKNITTVIDLWGKEENLLHPCILESKDNLMVFDFLCQNPS